MTMTSLAADADRSVFHLEREPEHPEGSSNAIGFWIYLMSDALIFAALFVTYAVLSVNYAGGPRPEQLFDFGRVALNTGIMLTSSFICGLAMLTATQGRLKAALVWLGVVGLLGLWFLVNQALEVQHMLAAGASFETSAFLSAFYTLLGTHGLHVLAGLIWIGVLTAHLLRGGMTQVNQTRMTCFSLFWNFLDITWVCVFTFVYLMGVVR